MNAPLFHRPYRWVLRAALGAALVLAAACTKREDPLAPPAAPAASMPVAAAAANAARAAAPTVAIPEVPPPPAGADLEQVAQNAAAFSDLVDSLRKFAGEEIELNAATLDLETFVRGKSHRDLLKFAEAAQWKSPFAALQVFEYLWRQDLDFDIRLQIAGMLGDLANQVGYAKDRAVARECVDWLAATCANPTQAAAMSVRERDNLLCTFHRLSMDLDDRGTADKMIADAIRISAQSDLELAYADEFDAFALIREGKAENIPAARAYFESMRTRGVYGTFFALKTRVDYWLAFDEAAFAAKIREMAEGAQRVHATIAREHQRREAMTPAELIAEINQHKQQP